MTEGIIQNTIYDFVKSLGYPHPEKQIMFMRLQDKLIEEIEKLRWHCCTNPQCPHAYSIEVKKLIGDSQE